MPVAPVAGAPGASRVLNRPRSHRWHLIRTGASWSWTYYEGAAGMPTDQRMVPTGGAVPDQLISDLREFFGQFQ